MVYKTRGYADNIDDVVRRSNYERGEGVCWT